MAQSSPTSATKAPNAANAAGSSALPHAQRQPHVWRQRGALLLSGTGLILAGLAVAGILALGVLTLWYWTDLPSLDKATDYRPRQHLQVFSADGVELAQFGSERRLFVPVDKVPKLLRDAVLAVEDTGFYAHGGISWRGLARAVVANLSGGMPQGASTITQQVARTFFLSTRRTPERKIKEALLALRLENELSKDEILELYLNQIFMGQRAYGVRAAAMVYFGKPLDQLTVAQTAMIAGLPQNPMHANPVNSPERAAKRQRWVLHRMQVIGAIDESTYQAALTEPLRLRSQPLQDSAAQHVAEMARKAVVERLGDKAYTEGVRVFTSVLAADQRAAYTALRAAVISHERKQDWRGPEAQEALPKDSESAERTAATLLKDHRDDEDLRVAIVLSATTEGATLQLSSGEQVKVHGRTMRWLRAALASDAPASLAIQRGSVVRLLQQQQPGKEAEWVITQWPRAEAAFVALQPETGRVRALVGSFEFDRQQFNRATSAMRQPGSSFKPFLYSAALEHGIMPETVVDDWPLLNADGSTPRWNPQNSDNQFDGDISVREGLVRSKNLVSIKLLQHLGLRQASNWIERFGFDMSKQPQDLTLALGTGSVSPMQLALGYAVFANGGHRVEPVLIERIIDANGRLLFEAPKAPKLDDSTRVVPARNVFLTNTLLRDVTLRGTAAKAQSSLRRSDLYGKTGTTNDAVDAWFAGFAPGVVAVGWVGYDEPRSLGERETGGGLALPIWIDSMRQMLAGVNLQAPRAPAGVVSVGNDWRYGEYVAGGFLPRIGVARETLQVDPTQPTSPALVKTVAGANARPDLAQRPQPAAPVGASQPAR